jgi:hypothetical protein
MKTEIKSRTTTVFIGQTTLTEEDYKANANRPHEFLSEVQINLMADMRDKIKNAGMMPREDTWECKHFHVDPADLDKYEYAVYITVETE